MRVKPFGAGVSELAATSVRGALVWREFGCDDGASRMRRTGLLPPREVAKKKVVKKKKKTKKTRRREKCRTPTKLSRTFSPKRCERKIDGKSWKTNRNVARKINVVGPTFLAIQEDQEDGSERREGQSVLRSAAVNI